MSAEPRPSSAVRLAASHIYTHGTPPLQSVYRPFQHKIDTTLTNPSSQGQSLDARLITEEPELVLAHLKARRANEEQLSSVSDIGGG